MKKLILPPSVQLAQQLERRDATPEEQVLCCGGCRNDKFRVVVGGDLVCGNCNEIVAGYKVWPESDS